MTDTKKRIEHWARKDLKRIGRETLQFAADAEALDKLEEELVKKHPGQWAAMYRGNLTLGKTMEEALKRQEGHSLGRARRQTAVKFLDPNPKTLILYAA